MVVPKNHGPACRPETVEPKSDHEFMKLPKDGLSPNMKGLWEVVLGTSEVPLTVLTEGHPYPRQSPSYTSARNKR